MHYMTDSSINEQAAFKGAASLPTPEQIAAQPWRYPQGRLPPEEETEPDFSLPWWENLMVWMFVIALSGVFWSAVYYFYRSLF
jgi:hypothetical protein